MKKKGKGSKLISQYGHINLWLPNEFIDKLEWTRKQLKLDNNIIALASVINFAYNIMKQKEEYLDGTELDSTKPDRSIIDEATSKIEPRAEN